MTEREVTDRITESGETAEMSASECTFYSLPVNRMDKKTAWHHSMRLIYESSLHTKAGMLPRSGGSCI